MQTSVQKLPSMSKELFLFFMRPYYKYMFLLLLVVIGFSSIWPIDSYILKRVIDFAGEIHGTNSESGYLMALKWGGVFFIWWEVCNIVWRFYNFVYSRCIPQIQGDVINALYANIQYNNHTFFQRNLAGEITYRIVEASRAFVFCLNWLYTILLRQVFAVIISVCVLWTIDVYFALIFLIWIVCFFGILLFATLSMNKVSEDYASQRTIISGKLVDTITNIFSVRLYNNHAIERDYLNKFVKTSVKTNVDMQIYILKTRYVLSLSCSVMAACMIAYGIMSSNFGEISAGDMAMMIALMTSMSVEIWQVTEGIGGFVESLGAFTQTVDLVNASRDDESFNANNSIATMPDLQVSSGSIIFKDVCFRYENSDVVLQNLNVIIKGGQSVGLVGFTGSGKSTFLNMIHRLYTPISGSVFIDDQDIEDMSISSICRNISVIPQNPLLFDRTILDNIKYGSENATIAEVAEAARIAYIHDEIMALPNGYSTMCGEFGSKLSGGQRQRVIIARSILKNAPILLLDEATSALDNVTEKLIQKSLEHIMPGKTVIAIAHRLSTIQRMDRLLVFSEGKIVEDGTHAELLRKNGLYTKLWESQTAGFID